MRKIDPVIDRVSKTQLEREMWLMAAFHVISLMAEGSNAINIIPGKACGLQTEVKTADRGLSASDIMRTYTGRPKYPRIYIVMKERG